MGKIIKNWDRVFQVHNQEPIRYQEEYECVKKILNELH